MSRRGNDPGFALVVVAAVVIAAGFAGFLFWRSQPGQKGGETPAPSPVVQTPVPAPAAPAAATNAQPLEPDDRLPLGAGASGVRYHVGDGVVVFQFDISDGEWPSVDADFDRNGALDEGIDRSFTFVDVRRYCAQTILAPDRWGECGSVRSSGNAELTVLPGGRVTAYVRVPASELSNDPQTAFVTFKVCTGRGRKVTCRQSPGGRTDGVADFTDEYAIKLQ